MARYMGPYPLPELTESEVAALQSKEFHKLKTSEHVQAMERLIRTGLETAPGDLEGVVFGYCEGDPNDPTSMRYAIVTQDGPEPEFRIIRFLGRTSLRVINHVAALNRVELLRERSKNQARA